MTAVPATDLVLMRLKDDLREGRDLGEHVPMLIARIEADRAELADARARNTAMALHFEREADQIMSERDANAETADMLAEAIASLTSADIGEHSSMNDPWLNALAAARAADR